VFMTAKLIGRIVAVAVTCVTNISPGQRRRHRTYSTRTKAMQLIVFFPVKYAMSRGQAQ
jgi:hypothetical protein